MNIGSVDLHELGEPIFPDGDVWTSHYFAWSRLPHFHLHLRDRDPSFDALHGDTVWVVR